MNIDFKEVIALTNKTGALTISDQPEEADGGRWAIYSGQLRGGSIKAPLDILYVSSSMNSRDDLDRAKRQLLARGGVRLRQIVYANSLIDDGRFPGVALGDSEDGIPRSGVREFFWSFAEQQLYEYIKQIRDRYSLADYIQPDVRGQSHGVSHASDDLWGRVYGRQPSAFKNGGISVLLAEPGQGKTYFSKYLTQRLASAGRIPLFVSSEQWVQLKAAEMSSLGRTVVHAFKWHDAPIHWADGAEYDFLRVAQKCGLFTLIFDGFDEYVLKTGSDTSAMDTMRKFRDLARASASQILLTSRTAFWEAEADAFKSVLEEDAVDGAIFYLRAFDSQHAKRYFEQRFPETPESVVLGSSIFGKLKAAVKDDKVDLVGRGMFLYLIADLVQRIESSSLEVQALGRHLINPLTWICENLCGRENTRQQLDVTLEQQFQLFEELAELIAADHSVPTQTFCLLIESSLGLSTSHSVRLVGIDGRREGKLAFHPLLSQSTDLSWRFRQEQVYFFFLARRVLSQLREMRESALVNFLCKLEGEKSLRFELATMLLNIISNHGSDRELSAVVTQLQRYEKIAYTSSELRNRATIATSLVLHALSGPLGRDKAVTRDRTARLLELLGPKHLEGLVFVDAAVNFDFSGLEIRDCRFENVTFLKCEFDVRTVFIGCGFIGCNVRKSPSIKAAFFDDACVMDPEFRRLLLSDPSKRGARDYNMDDLNADFVGLLQYLMGFLEHPSKLIPESKIVRSKWVSAPLGPKISECIERFVIESRKSNRSGTKYFGIRPSAVPAMKFYQGNGILTGSLMDAWQELTREAAKAGVVSTRVAKN
jgi:hypothetical protein